MFIQESAKNHVLEDIALKFNVPMERLHILVSSYNNFVFEATEEEFSFALDYLRRNRDTVVRTARDGKGASTFIFIMLRLAPKSRSFLRNPPPEIFHYLSANIRDWVQGRGTRSLDPNTVRIVLKYIGIEGRRGILDGEFIAPTHDEIRYLEEKIGKPIEEIVTTQIFRFYGWRMKYDWKTREIKLLGKTIYRVEDEEKFYALLEESTEKHGLYIRFAAGLLEKVNETIRRKTGGKIYGSINEGLSTIEIMDDLEKIASKLGVKIPDKLKYFSLTIEISPKYDRRTGTLLLNIVARFRDGLMRPEYRKSIPYKDLDKILLEIKNLIQEGAKQTSLILEIEDALKEKAGTGKYREKLKNISHYMGLIKDENTYSTYIALSHEKEKWSNALVIIVEVTYAKKVYLPVLIDELDKAGISRRKIDQENDKLRVTYEYRVNSVEEAMRAFTCEEKIKEAIKEARKEFLLRQRRKTKPKYRPIEPEKTIASYIVLVTRPEENKTDTSFILDRVRSIIKEKGTDEARKLIEEGARSSVNTLLLYYERMLAELVLSNIIYLEENYVAINGKRLHKILEEMGYDKATSATIEKEASSTILSALSTLSPDELMKEVGGKPIWKMLLPEMKKEYIKNMPLRGAEKIIETPELEEKFKDVVRELAWRLVKESSPPYKTLAAYKHLPGIFGSTPVKLKLTSTPGTHALEVGGYYVQIYRHEDNETWYLIYKKNRNIGFLYSGRTITEALLKASKTYDELYKKYSGNRYRDKYGSLIVVKDENGPIKGEEVAKKEEALQTL